MDEKQLTANGVKAWLAAVEIDMGRLGEQLEPLLTEQRRLEERRALLEGLLRSFNQANGSEPDVATRATGSVRDYVISRAVEILRDEGQPLNINDLHAKFVERGFAIPGAGKAVNLIVHIRSADEIVSPRRGVYGLADQVGAIPNSPRPRRRRKGRTRRPKS